MRIGHQPGRRPEWLGPGQAVVLSITDDHADYAEDVVQLLRGSGLRVESDTRNEKIGYKIREQTLARVPLLLVVGARERDSGTVAVRSRDGEDLGSMPLDQAMALLSQQAQAPDNAAREANRQGLLDRLSGMSV